MGSLGISNRFQISTEDISRREREYIVERALKFEESQLKKLKSSLARRTSANKRIRLIGRIANCEARIAALILAHR